MAGRAEEIREVRAPRFDRLGNKLHFTGPATLSRRTAAISCGDPVLAASTKINHAPWQRGSSSLSTPSRGFSCRRYRSQCISRAVSHSPAFFTQVANNERLLFWITISASPVCFSAFYILSECSEGSHFSLHSSLSLSASYTDFPTFNATSSPAQQTTQRTTQRTTQQ